MTCKVNVPRVFDLRESTTHTALSLTDAQLFSEVGDYTACQAIGAAARQLGLAGLIAPAARRRGETLALFSANLPAERGPKSPSATSGEASHPTFRYLQEMLALVGVRRRQVCLAFEY